MKRSIKLLLAAVAMLSVMCAGAAFAAADKMIMWGASGIEGPTEKTGSSGKDSGKYYEPNDYIYYGMNNGTGPIKWRVLDTKTNIGTDGLFLLSEWVLESNVYFIKKYHAAGAPYHRGDDPGGVDHSACVDANVYQGSDAQAWCGTFAAKASNFSAAEQAAFLGVNKDDAPGSLHNSYWLSSSLTEAEDKMFFLSVHELAKYVGDYARAPGYKAYRDASAQVLGNASVWWLRSPYDDFNSRTAGAVNAPGDTSSRNVYDPCEARPAFNLDLNSVLFTSAAAGGKHGGAAAGENFFKNADNSSNEWKVTLLDSSRSGFKAEAAGQTGDTLTISYSGAKTGQNEYISAIIKDSSDNISHYGRLKNIPSANDAAGTVDVPMTDEQLAAGTLYIFNEQYNGDHKTDYASELKKIELYTVTVTHDSNGTADANPKNAVKDTEITLSATPITPGYVFDKWEVVKPTTGLTITGNKFTMPDEPVEVKATFKRSSTPPSTPDPTPSYTTGKYNGAIDSSKTDGLWDARAGGDLTIHIDVSFDQFTQTVSLDDEPLTQDTATVSHDFGAREGSTIVTIWEHTLREHITTDGEHKAEVGFKDGSAIHTFTARGTGETPKTRRSSEGACAAGTAASVAIVGLAALKRRRR